MFTGGDGLIQAASRVLCGARSASFGRFELLEGAAGCATWTGSVGAIFSKDNADGRVFVREVPLGMAAARAGVAVGDELVAIDDRPVSKMTPAEVHEALAGKVGTNVKVTLVRNGSRIDIVIERGPFAGT